MNDPRLLFYNDARHYHMYNYEPPMTLEQARAPIDEIAGTGVDTFVYGFGPGPTVFHLTKVGEIFGSRLPRFRDLPGIRRGTVAAWRAYENIMSLNRQGLDVLEILINRAHERGLRFFASVRQCHGGEPDDVDNYFNSQFSIDHPEWLLTGRGKPGLNWIHPEVRAERLAILEEALNDYDVDGLEIDWVTPVCFEDDHLEEGREILTQYMGDVRCMVERASKTKDRKIQLGARVLPVLSGNQAVGIDVVTWIQNGILDFVVPNYYIDHQLDTDFPFEWLVDLCRSNDCRVYPVLQSRVGRPKEADVEPIGQRQANIAHYRAGAAAYFHKGADGIYLPWFNWPIGPDEREILGEINDPERLKGKPMHYVVRGQNANAAQHGYVSQLPASLETGGEAPGKIIRIYVAEDPKNKRVIIRVRLMYTVAADVLTITMNGRTLPMATCRRTAHGYSPTEGPNVAVVGIPYAWLEFDVPEGLIQEGPNEVGVALETRPSNLAGVVDVSAVELTVC
jgi:hypothetical protein